MIVILITLFALLIIFTLASYRKTEQKQPIKPPSSARLIIEQIAGHEVCDEKVNALTLEAKNTLVTARAGSGKTMTIALKMALEVHSGVKPEYLLALSFNKSAALELGGRMTKYGVKDIPSATFHSLAYAIVKPRHGSLIFGDKQRELVHALFDVPVSDDGLDSFLSFISRIKHENLDLEELRVKAKDIGNEAQLAVEMYEKYIKHTQKRGLLDFDDLIKQATKKLKKMSKAPIVRLGGKVCDLDSLRLVAIDEFQDFSSSFYNLVSALRDTNSSMGVYAVGDDWQAINSFAGSNLCFFNDFDSYFVDSAKAQLLTNYRSGKTLIEHSNKSMKGLGKGAEAVRKGGVIDVLRIDNGSEVICVQRALLHVLKVNKSSFLALFRCNKYRGKNIGEWQEILAKTHPNIRCSTIHKAKGMEADTVVYFQEPQRNMLTTQLNAVLNIQSKDTQQEERRIEYVALTRARKRLVVIS
jgi:superfamily I DNA/RNA helicase